MPVLACRAGYRAAGELPAIPLSERKSAITSVQEYIGTLRKAHKEAASSVSVNHFHAPPHQEIEPHHD
jgi:hypothetical protein